MAEPTLGKELPPATLPSTLGKTFRSPDDFKGHWTVLYFYPKDDTPGCTRQACSYRDRIREFEKLGVKVYGVSMDDLLSHEKFMSKYGLTFTLLSDSKRELSEPLGVYGEHDWQGFRYTGLSRDTVLLDPKGVIRKIWRRVSPVTTVDETLEAVTRYLRFEPSAA